MECRKFDLKLISATNLRDVRKIFRMKVYAVVTIAGKAKTERRTPVDKEGETNPTWNFTLQYMIGELAVQNEGIEVHPNVNGGGANILTRQVQSSSGISQGELKFSFGFGETVIIKRPSKWRKMLKAGTVVLLNLISAVLGQGNAIPLFMDAGSGVDFM
ncbi:unnamed protein product [Ilex paraguariensis]|uniref:C2 domain-containing protein n=1 Tax=Ilex paraguariensis TaxID=185542 RepID=A0ABC8SMC0_9AQUA